MKTVTLYRLTGTKKLKRIERASYRESLPQLTVQPIFHLVRISYYTMRIAKIRSVKNRDYVFSTHFEIDSTCLNQLEVQGTDGQTYQDYGLSSKPLEVFNTHSDWMIEISQSFLSSDITRQGGNA